MTDHPGNVGTGLSNAEPSVLRPGTEYQRARSNPPNAAYQRHRVEVRRRLLEDALHDLQDGGPFTVQVRDRRSRPTIVSLAKDLTERTGRPVVIEWFDTEAVLTYDPTRRKEV